MLFFYLLTEHSSTGLVMHLQNREVLQKRTKSVSFIGYVNGLYVLNLLPCKCHYCLKNHIWIVKF